MTETRLQEMFPEADLILLEGFKYSSYPKMEILRQGNSETGICPKENLVAWVSDFCRILSWRQNRDSAAGFK